MSSKVEVDVAQARHSRGYGGSGRERIKLSPTCRDSIEAKFTGLQVAAKCGSIRPGQCARGEIGRRASFRVWWVTPVEVRVLSCAQISLIGSLSLSCVDRVALAVPLHGFDAIGALGADDSGGGIVIVVEAEERNTQEFFAVVGFKGDRIAPYAGWNFHTTFGDG